MASFLFRRVFPKQLLRVVGQLLGDLLCAVLRTTVDTVPHGLSRVTCHEIDNQVPFGKGPRSESRSGAGCWLSASPDGRVVTVASTKKSGWSVASFSPFAVRTWRMASVTWPATKVFL